MDHPRPNLRYVDAGDLDDTATRLKGIEVDSSNGEKLGKVEGFIIDGTTGRPYHVVVGSGGWFRHKHFLLPIGHVALPPAGKALVADLTKDRVERFPGFDKDEFKKLSEADLKSLDNTMAAMCCPDEVVAVDLVEWETAPHLSYPSWWDADFYRPDRADKGAMNVGGATHLSGGPVPAGVMAGGARDQSRERDRVVARADVEDNGVRAQPGDVLGLDTDGERTYIGDTSEDEDKRRVAAEKAAKG
jgi:sporulation protein YlmC with PRC-barrel domain